MQTEQDGNPLPTGYNFYKPIEEKKVETIEFDEELAAAEGVEKIAGDIFTSIPKEILAVNTLPDDSTLVYLVSWQQDPA